MGVTEDAFSEAAHGAVITIIHILTAQKKVEEVWRLEISK
jgi:hypothetical protein